MTASPLPATRTVLFPRQGLRETYWDAVVGVKMPAYVENGLVWVGYLVSVSCDEEAFTLVFEGCEPEGAD